MAESKYTSQIKNLRQNYVRFPLDLKPDVLEAFKRACTANGTTPTTEIKKFIARYVAAAGLPEDTTTVTVESSQQLLDRAAQQGLDLSAVLTDALTDLMNQEKTL